MLLLAASFDASKVALKLLGSEQDEALAAPLFWLRLCSPLLASLRASTFCPDTRLKITTPRTMIP